MLFNSLPYLVFLPIVVLIYYVLSPKFRWILLLVASYFFYGYLNAEFLILIAISTVVDYVASNLIQNSSKNWWRRILLGVSVSTNLGILFLFKYLKLFLPPKEMMFMSIKAAEMPVRGAQTAAS